ncbi:AMP deaminase [Perkinsus olseni]|uniref:AMP deaminase n=1 Tax=Perkinsus olseni TaxID=32597 RepID=A0A7J6PJU4_PEROL|nr:AMP deaminase [Perkinsus olseni]
MPPDIQQLIREERSLRQPQQQLPNEPAFEGSQGWSSCALGQQENCRWLKLVEEGFEDCGSVWRRSREGVRNDDEFIVVAINLRTEKRIEIDFAWSGEESDLGARVISRTMWDKILALCECTIVSHKVLKRFDAYILSESSLFVCADKVAIITLLRSYLEEVIRV